MKKHKLDERHIREHVKIHRDFVDEVEALFKDHEDSMFMDKFNDITEYLIRWLAYHILNTDKGMVHQIDLVKINGMSSDQAFEFDALSKENSTEPLLKALKVLYHLVVKKNKEIEMKNRELEIKVMERTAQLEHSNQKLNEMLLEDTLTKLPNRRYVMNEVQKLIDNYERYEEVFSILFIDLDKFKSVNDNYGHDYGDKVLLWVADFLKSNIRKTDIACRLGGDEFVIICSHTDEHSGMKIGEKLKKVCQETNDEIVEYWKPSLSIGVVVCRDKVSTPSELLKIADEAMYLSKTSGGGKTSLV